MSGFVCIISYLLKFGNGKKVVKFHIAWSFHLAVHFYPIPALHFAENFTALPA